MSTDRLSPAQAAKCLQIPIAALYMLEVIDTGPLPDYSVDGKPTYDKWEVQRFAKFPKYIELIHGICRELNLKKTS